MEKTLADYFAEMVVPFVYEGDKTEGELIAFLSESAEVDQTNICKVPVWSVRFEDDSFALFIPDRMVFQVGMVKEIDGAMVFEF